MRADNSGQGHELDNYGVSNVGRFYEVLTSGIIKVVRSDKTQIFNIYFVHLDNNLLL